MLSTWWLGHKLLFYNTKICFGKHLRQRKREGAETESWFIFNQHWLVRQLDQSLVSPVSCAWQTSFVENVDLVLQVQMSNALTTRLRNGCSPPGSVRYTCSNGFGVSLIPIPQSSGGVGRGLTYLWRLVTRACETTSLKPDQTNLKFDAIAMFQTLVGGPFYITICRIKNCAL